MTKINYSASYTAAALLADEFQSIRSFLTASDFEVLIDQEAIENNYLQIKTETSRKRIVLEMKKRYHAVPENFWNFTETLNDAEFKLALFYICLKTYTLVMDFHVEVALRKWDLGFTELDNYELQMRLDEIASMDDEVYDWSDVTKKKVIRGYKTMLKQANLLKNDTLHKPRTINPHFWDYFIENAETWFIEACFYRKTADGAR
ncbi:MAG: hypothetical protein ACI85O_000447 [Saprospiraceae bacterium]|jgi:hypothetical protein